MCIMKEVISTIKKLFDPSTAKFSFFFDKKKDMLNL